MLLLLLACGTPERTPEPVEDRSAMRSALTQLQEGGVPDNVPPAGEPPDVPEAVSGRRAPPEAQVETREDPAECKAAKARRERQEQAVLEQRGRTVNAAEDRVDAAKAAMARCVQDMECAVDGKRVQELMERDLASEKAYEAAIEGVGKLEAELFAIDQEIAKVCGLPGR